MMKKIPREGDGTMRNSLVNTGMMMDMMRMFGMCMMMRAENPDSLAFISN